MGTNEWVCKVILPSVSFASLVTPSDEELKQLPVVEFSESCIMLLLQYINFWIGYCRVGTSLSKTAVSIDCFEACDKAVLLPAAFPPSPYSPQGLLCVLPLNLVSIQDPMLSLQDYVAHYREWGPPPTPLPLQCGQARVSKAQQPCGHDAQSGSLPDAVSINGRRVFLCSFNGVVFQVTTHSLLRWNIFHFQTTQIPIDSDESGDEEVMNEAVGLGARPEYPNDPNDHIDVDTDQSDGNSWATEDQEDNPG